MKMPTNVDEMIEAWGAEEVAQGFLEAVKGMKEEKEMENKRIAYISLGLENCEEIELDVKDVPLLGVHGIAKNLTLVHRGQDLLEAEECKEMLLVISKEADKPFGEGNEMTVFQRLAKWRDIVCLAFLDKDKKGLRLIYVPWGPGSGQVNSYEHHLIEEDGSLKIAIKGE